MQIQTGLFDVCAFLHWLFGVSRVGSLCFFFLRCLFGGLGVGRLSFFVLVILKLCSCFYRLLEKITAAVKHTKPTNLSELQSVVDRVHGLAGIVAAAEDHCLTLEEVKY